MSTFPLKLKKDVLKHISYFESLFVFYLRALIIPLLKRITNRIMEIFLETSGHTIIDGMQIVYDICTALEYQPELIFHIFTNCLFTKILKMELYYRYSQIGSGP